MDKMLFLSNLFPSKNNPEFGTFVKHNLELLTTEYCVDKVVITKSKGKLEKIYKYICYFFEVLNKVRLERYDMIYVHYPSYSYIPIYILAMFNNAYTKNTSIVINLHGSDFISDSIPNKYLNKIVTSKAIYSADKVIVPSSYFKQEVIKQCKIDSTKLFVSYSGGYDSDVFNTNGKQHNNKLTFVYCSRLISSKGLSVLIESIVQLKNDYLVDLKDIQFLVIGDGPEKEKQEENVIKFGLSDYISFLGFKSQADIATTYKSSHVFIFPTEKESLGLVGIEAMASGLLLIGTDHPALKTYLIHGVNGYTFPVGSSKELSKIMHTQYLKFYSSDSTTMNEEMIENSLNSVRKFEKTAVGKALLEQLKRIKK